MTTLNLTLLIAGIIAGSIQYFVDFKGLKIYEPSYTARHSDNKSNWFVQFWNFISNYWEFFAYVIVGIGGAFLVPVIHELTNGGLRGLTNIKDFTACLEENAGNSKEVTKCPLNPWYLLVLFGYGIILGYSAVRIIRGIGNFLLGNITNSQEELQKKNREADQKVKDLTLKVEELMAKLPPKQVLQPAISLKLETSLNQNYFDERINEIDKRTYYAEIDFGDKDTLYSKLNILLTSTHKVKLPYKPSLHLYPNVDLYEDGLLRSIYSGKSFDLQTLLEMDAQVERARTEAYANFDSLISHADHEIKLENIEESLPYNCEHVVPQSWFSRKEPMKGDLHHLFTCEMRCNSFRNNYKYYDFPDYGAALTDIIRDECGKLENSFFEPERNKGVVARAVLYFLVRYPSAFIPETGYSSKDIPMLVKWHNEEPITLYELHRNQYIYKVQGNRNPFIDYPVIADKINFESYSESQMVEFDELLTPNIGDDENAFAEWSNLEEFTSCEKNPDPKPWIDWKPSKCLMVLLDQVNNLAPNRKTDSDGLFGDLAHQETNSDHNPWVWDNVTKIGIVTALDITHDPSGNCDCDVLAKSLEKNKDSRIKYVIWNNQIMSSYSKDSNLPWTWRAYDGTNPHNMHIHISVMCDQEIRDSALEWDIEITQ